MTKFRKKVLSDFNNKKVLITGHTGFKGSWLTQWLLLHKAKVYGISDTIPTSPSLFEILKLSKSLEEDIRIDITDGKDLISNIKRIKPDFIFHLAAQPIVSLSYEDPVETIRTNVMGTVNLLEACRYLKNRCAVVIVTTDKCYENKEWVWGYKETDTLGGKDVYSGSKAAAEILFSSYFRSFLKHLPNIRIASVRAGNVIGGGDWAKDRLVSDCMVAWSENKKVKIRNPYSTRPWQHVLEPLSGYVNIANSLWHGGKINGEGFNFGPKSENNINVLELITRLGDSWNFDDINSHYTQYGDISFAEGNLLKLNCDKALHWLGWQPVLSIEDSVYFTGQWYLNYYKTEENIINYTKKQITSFESRAQKKRISWAMD